MKSTTIKTYNEQDTIDAGAELAKGLAPGDIVTLSGTLGAGKTRFIKGVCRGLGISAQVTSPTFNIVNQYWGGDEYEPLSVLHMDLYRLKSLPELHEAGIFDFLNNQEHICLIEWPDIAQLAENYNIIDVSIELMPDDETGRIIRIDSK